MEGFMVEKLHKTMQKLILSDFNLKQAYTSHQNKENSKSNNEWVLDKNNLWFELDLIVLIISMESSSPNKCLFDLDDEGDPQIDFNNSEGSYCQSFHQQNLPFSFGEAEDQ